jgi:2-polyprenyl-3-methyl-5-hydroxy-6-metoxy-1,4-benzoquinol methylase
MTRLVPKGLQIASGLTHLFLTIQPMLFLDSVNRRRLQPELMDQPDLEPERLHKALLGLERINWFSRSAHILWPAINAAATNAGLSTLSLLDIGTGAGDIPIRIWRKARRAGFDLQIAGCDQSRRSIDFARKRAEKYTASVSFFQHDVIANGIPGEYDVIMCSLFLHHLQESIAVEVLRAMARSARRLVLVNDLARGKPGLLLALVATRMLTTSEVVHVDGPRSVEGAFTPREAQSLARGAGLQGAVVLKKWPCRYLLVWKRPCSS